MKYSILVFALLSVFSAKCAITEGLEVKIDKEHELMVACSEGDLSKVKLLVEKEKANINTIDGKGFIPLFYAAACGHLNVVKYLIESDLANLNTQYYCLQWYNIGLAGCIAINFANLMNHHDVVEYLKSKDFLLPSKDCLKNLFYSDAANSKFNLDAVDLLAYHQIPIHESTSIASMENGGMIHIYQPKVFKQSDDSACVEEQLQQEVEKFGGTKKMHKNSNPIIGGTCAYNATKNALVSLLLLHDYDQLAENNQSSADYVTSDLESFKQLKSKYFDSELFIEKLHAKTFAIKYIPIHSQDAIHIMQSFSKERFYIAQPEIENDLQAVLKQRYKNLSVDNSLSFVDATAISNINSKFIGCMDSCETLYKDGKEYLGDVLDRIRDFDLLQQIALFRTNKNYRHAFTLTLNTYSVDGWGEPRINSDLHAISVVIDKKDNNVNVIICESNNLIVWSLKQIVYDFLQLFIYDRVGSLDSDKITSLVKSASNKLGVWIEAPEPRLPSFESLVRAYIYLKNNNFDNLQRDKVHYAIFLLSKIQYVYDKAKEKRDPAYLTIQKILKEYNLFEPRKNVIRNNEIALYSAIGEIELQELEENLMRFIHQGNKEKIKEALDLGANIDAITNYSTPLILAIRQKNYVIFKYILDLGANIECKDKSGCTPLMQAAVTGQYEIVEKLLSLGVDTSITDNDGLTALAHARHSYSTQKKAEIIKLLENSKK